MLQARAIVEHGCIDAKAFAQIFPHGVRHGEMTGRPARQPSFKPIDEAHHGVTAAEPQTQHCRRAAVPIDDKAGAPRPGRDQGKRQCRQGGRILHNGHIEPPLHRQ